MPYKVTTDSQGAAVVEANVPQSFPDPKKKRDTRIPFDTGRVILKGARDLTQELLGNLPADEFSKLGTPRKPGAPDAKILGVFPALPEVEVNAAEGFVAGFVQAGLGFALARFGLGRGAAAARRLPGAGAAARVTAPARAVVSQTAQAMRSAPGAKGLAGRIAVSSVKEAPAGMVTAYAAFKPEEKRLSDSALGYLEDRAADPDGGIVSDAVRTSSQALQWVESQIDTPLGRPLADLVRSQPGDTATEARWKNAVESLFLEPAANGIIQTLGFAAKAAVAWGKAFRGAKPVAEQTVETTAKAVTEPGAPPAAAKPGKPPAAEIAEPGLPAQESALKAEADYKKAIDDVEVAVARAAGTVPDSVGAVTPEARGTILPSYSQVRETSVADIATDPQRFQFKEAGRLNKTGASGSLAKATEYDPLFGKIVSVWRDPADGLLYVVNGHNRLDLAKRSGRQNILTWEIEAPSAEQARAIGAMENMAEGMGTPWDAAKIMRDMGVGVDQLRQRSIDVRGPVAEKAIPLSRLPQDIFDKGATGKLDLAKAMALGSEPLDEAIVRDVAAAASKSKWSAEKILQAMQEAKFAQTSGPSGGVLPGMEDMFKTSNFDQLLNVRTEAFKALREEMVALTSAAIPGRKGVMEAAGNVIDVAGSQAAREQAAAAVEVFNRVTGYTGPVRDLLNEMAGQVKGKRTAAVVVKENVGRLRQAIEDEINGPRLPLEQPPAAAAAPTPAAASSDIQARIAALGPEPEPPVAPKLVSGGKTVATGDTRGQGLYFHGTAQEIPGGIPKSVESGDYWTNTNLFGNGFYTTDDFSTAGSYTAKGKEAAIKNEIPVPALREYGGEPLTRLLKKAGATSEEITLLGFRNKGIPAPERLQEIAAALDEQGLGKVRFAEEQAMFRAWLQGARGDELVQNYLDVITKRPGQEARTIDDALRQRVQFLLADLRPGAKLGNLEQATNLANRLRELADNPPQAKEYKPIIYLTKEKKPVKFFDADEMLDWNSADPEVAALKKQSGSEVWDEILGDWEKSGLMSYGEMLDTARGASYNMRYSASDLTELFDGINAELAKLGYGGLAHQGGIRAGGGRRTHSVRIYWDAENQLEVKTIKPGKAGVSPEARDEYEAQLKAYNDYYAKRDAIEAEATAPATAAPPAPATAATAASREQIADIDSALAAGLADMPPADRIALRDQILAQRADAAAEGGTASRAKIDRSDFNAVGEGARLIRRLSELSKQAKAAEGPELARLTNEIRDAIADFRTPLWKRPVISQGRILNDLRAELKRIAGPELSVNFEPKIKLTPAEIAAARRDWGIPDSVPDKDITTAGLYDPVTNLVRIALAGKNPHQLRGTGYHEAVHFVIDYLATPQEKAVLRAARPELEKIAARGGQPDLALADDVEIIAESAAVYSLSRQAGEPIKTTKGVRALFDKFLKFLEATRNWAQGNGFQTWDDVFERIYQGEMAGRPLGEFAPLQETLSGGRVRIRPDEPEGPVPVDPPPGPANNENWVRQFAREVVNNEKALQNGEVTLEDLMANNFQKVQSPSGKTIYVVQRENLVEGLNAMSKVLPDRATESGIPVMNVEQLRRSNQDWFDRHGEDGESIMKGLDAITRGFSEYEQGALNRAMAYADLKQVEASREAALWLNSASFDGLNESERLARLISAAESSRAVHQAVMRVTRPWGQMGLEMQMSRDYEIPPYRIDGKGAVDVPATAVPDAGDAARTDVDGLFVDGLIKKELEVEQGKSIDETITDKIDPELTAAVNGGEITPKAMAAADAFAQTLVSIGADSKARTKFYRNFDDVKTLEPNALLMLRTNNLISSGVTLTTNLTNGMFNLARLPLQQAAGAALTGESKRAMYSLMMYQQYWMNMSNALRVAGHAFKAGQSLFNLENSTVDYLARVAKEEAQLELMQGPKAMTGWTVNTMDMGVEYAKTPLGQLANHLWRVLGTGATRLALTVDTFNSTLAGQSFEHVRHLPRGMELAVERGMKDMSPEAWKWAQQYAAARTDEAIKDAVINGKSLADVHLDSPHAQKFMDSVNFTDSIWAQLEPRTYNEGVRLGMSRGLEGQELQDFAKKYINEGMFGDKLAGVMTEGPLQVAGRLTSYPGEIFNRAANVPGIGPVVRFVQPFMRVGVNIIKGAARNTPAAVFVDTFWRDITSADAFTRDRALGEMATGTAALALASMAAGMGYIRFNGGGPIDPELRRKWTDIEQRAPYTVQVWSDEEGRWSEPISMRAFEPFTTLFGGIGDYVDIANSLSDENRNRLGAALTLTVVRMSTMGVLSKAYFQGFTEFYEAAFNPSKVMTGANQRDAWSRYFARLAASMVPYSSALRAARRETDQIARSVDPSEIGGLMGFFQETLDEVRNGVPGFSNTLPARRDFITGAPILTVGILGSDQIPAEMPWLQGLLQFAPWSSMQVKRQIMTPVHEEMALLHGKGTTFSGPRASDFGTEMRLKPSELEDYVQIFATVKDELTGRTFLQSATALIESQQYKSWPIEGASSKYTSLRAAALQAEIAKYKELAKKEYKATTAKGQEIAKEEKAAQEDKDKKDYLRKRMGGDNQYGGATAPASRNPRAFTEQVNY